MDGVRLFDVSARGWGRIDLAVHDAENIPVPEDIVITQIDSTMADSIIEVSHHAYKACIRAP